MPWATFKQDNEFCVFRIDADGDKTGETLGCHPTRAEAQEQVAALYTNEPGAKAGARHSDKDRRLVKDIHDKADEIRKSAIELGHEIEQAVEHVKADDLPRVVEPQLIFGAIKALADGWELDVLAVPFGGPEAGKDSHGEYFDAQTKTYREQFPEPLIVYYHGFSPDGRPQGEPVVIGKARFSHTDTRGHWYRVVLNRALSLAKRVREAALKGIARASTGTVAHLKRVARDGRILNWPVVEISLFDIEGKRQPANAYAVALPALKAHYAKAGLPLPQLPPEAQARGADNASRATRKPSAVSSTFKSKEFVMDDMELTATVEEAAEEDRAAQAALEQQKAEENARIAAAVKLARAQMREEVQAEREQERREVIKARRLNLGAPPATPVMKFDHLRKYDALGMTDLAFAAGMLDAIKRKDNSNPGVSREMAQALAVKIAEDKTPIGAEGQVAMKACGLTPMDVLDGLKANELNYTTQTGFGDEWVPTVWSAQIWEQVRAAVAVLQKLPTKEYSGPGDTFTIPLESTDPTWYRIGQATDLNATTGRPDATVGDSKLATTNKNITLAKMGTRIPYSGEMIEDSIVEWAAQVRAQTETSFGEQLEHAIIDGDTATGATTNINHIGGTPTSTGTKQDLFLLFDGLRKLALVTNTANSRSAAGGLADTDFLETVKLMGTVGLLGADVSKVDFLIDANVNWKVVTLASVKTRDVFLNATLENGFLKGIWGYNVMPSYFVHFKSAVRKANTAGKVDQTTTTNNTTGSILSVRWDQWLFGYKRRMIMKLQDIPDSDAQQLVATARCGLIPRDNEAAAISFNVGV